MSARARLAVVLLLLAPLLVLLPTASASADNGCPGTRDAWLPLKDTDGYSVATLETYDIAGSNQNCYALVSRGRFRGIKKWMSLTMCGEVCKTDQGNFTTYAGPITSASCARAVAQIKDPTGRTVLRYNGYAGSCD